MISVEFYVRRLYLSLFLFLHTYNLIQGLQLKNGGIHRIIYIII
jgi:hypothetical protein